MDAEQYPTDLYGVCNPWMRLVQGPEVVDLCLTQITSLNPRTSVLHQLQAVSWNTKPLAASRRSQYFRALKDYSKSITTVGFVESEQIATAKKQVLIPLPKEQTPFNRWLFMHTVFQI